MGGAGKSTYFLTVFPDMPSSRAMPLRENTLQPGVLDGFPQGLLPRRCLSGRRGVRGGPVVIVHRLVGRCAQDRQALKLLSVQAVFGSGS